MPLFAPFDLIWRQISKLLAWCNAERLTLPFYRFLAGIGLGTIRTRPDSMDSGLTKCIWEAAEKRGIHMYEFCPLGRTSGIFAATHGKEAFAFDGLPRPHGPASRALAWMDDKAIMRKKFISAGIPVARGGACLTASGAEKIFSSFGSGPASLASQGGPAVVKPSTGSRGRHTTMHVMTREELLIAFRKAKQLSPIVVVEEELSGFVYRPTLIGGKLIAVASKEPPHVKGDGAHTVRELTEKENERRGRHASGLHRIPTDERAERELGFQHFTWESIPKAGRVVTLSEKTSRAAGGIIVDYTDAVHPENVKLFERIGAVLEEPLVGIDFVIRDISRPWREQEKCGVIECNSLPFIDLHSHPTFGTPRDVAGALWEYLFPATDLTPPTRQETR
ncbi:MAG: hypothetical protein A2946_02195 [Candidatus Liptonbacteria bacterium RIFCSPLOWO2_01_FULL_53_13]|uniref:ATP-grasp domain-containing protein n=1 Tax=Candidatus Liptonbacteria bacterium RIFCSPLOWO2_01_FULL_53_13 TaxID=1798651 RepID=A0A1G2CGM1_9BACT|nr:MAG: hypothetical protein A2946_02195 [Candidatus Liptonbacteria bacterium RIFCSPLOWO2_01_FULL_53_13]